MSKALPYMQFYVADYLAATAHLTAAQNGAYLLLLFNYWQRAKPLNNTNERLCNVARMSMEEWMACKHEIAEFFDINGDEWRHARVDEDLANVLGKSISASNAGTASANKRKLLAEQKLTAARQFTNDRSTTVQPTLNRNPTTVEQSSNQNKSSLQHHLNENSDEFGAARKNHLGNDAPLFWVVKGDAEPAESNRIPTVVERSLSGRSAAVQQSFNENPTDVQHSFNHKDKDKDKDKNKNNTPEQVGLVFFNGTEKMEGAVDIHPDGEDWNENLFSGIGLDNKTGQGVIDREAPVKKKKAVLRESEAFPDVADRGLIADWFALRRSKNAPVTQTVINLFMIEVSKLGWTVEQGLQKWCASGWAGFEADWHARKGGFSGGNHSSGTRHLNTAGKDYSEGVSADGRLTLLR
jgi:uncharacterized protein YdaU (DUF1376 family)